MKTFKELLDRLYDIQGVPFVELAAAHGITWHGEPAKDKRLAGAIVEAALGKEADSLPEPDLTFLNMEVKTVPIREGLQPREHTKICSLNPQDVVDQEWERSTVYHKLRSILFVPVVKYELQRPDQWYIRSPFVWMPSITGERELRADYEAVRELLLQGRADEVSSARPPKGQGENLIANTGGRDSRDLTRYAINGQQVEMKRRAWMLRKDFVRRVMEENVRYSPVTERPTDVVQKKLRP